MSNAFVDNPETIDNVQLVQPEPKEETIIQSAFQEPKETQPIVEPVVEPVVETQPVSDEIEIEGIGKVKREEIKEWKQGYMRQSDYTKKTQQVAAQRKEAEKALELYNFLGSNPQIAQAIQSGDISKINVANTPLEGLHPVAKEIEKLNVELATMKLDAELSRLKASNADFDELETLRVANEKGIADLELVWNSIKTERAATTPIDRAALEAQIRKEITEQIRRDGISTSTIISGNDGTVQTSTVLTPEERRIAINLGLTESEYQKHKR